jgi:hypothetical protein
MPAKKVTVTLKRVVTDSVEEFRVVKVKNALNPPVGAFLTKKAAELLVNDRNYEVTVV